MILNPAAGRTNAVDRGGADRNRPSVHASSRPWFGRLLAVEKTLLLFALAFSFLGASREIYGQEVVVFTDFRSLVVSSHRETGSWVYLRVGSGELAVQSSQIAEIRNEGPQAEVAARAIPQPEPSTSDDDVVPAPAVEQAIADMEPASEKAPRQKLPRALMDGAIRPMGLRNRQPVQPGTTGDAGRNSVKR